MKDVVIVNLVAKRNFVDLDLPTIKMASTGQLADIVEVSGIKNGNSITFTVRPRKTEDAEFEFVEQKKIES